MAATYAAYAVGVFDTIKDMIVAPDAYQTFDFDVAISAAGNSPTLLCRGTKIKGVVRVDTQSLSAASKARPATFPEFKAAFDGFTGLKQFLAYNGGIITGAQSGAAIDAALSQNQQHSMATFRIAYRKKGQSSKKSQTMKFIGFPDNKQAIAYVLALQEQGIDLLVKDNERPFAGKSHYEWM
jgi:hypothetical protein